MWVQVGVPRRCADLAILSQAEQVGEKCRQGLLRQTFAAVSAVQHEAYLVGGPSAKDADLSKEAWSCVLGVWRSRGFVHIIFQADREISHAILARLYHTRNPCLGASEVGMGQLAPAGGRQWEQ